MRFLNSLLFLAFIFIALQHATCQPFDTLSIPSDDDATLREVIITSSQGVVEQGFFRDGLKTGVWRKYGERGNMLRVSHYYYGEFDGLQLTFNNTNVLEKEENYRKGKLHGLYREYNASRLGAVIKEIYYRHGKIHGIKKEYFDDGKILMEIGYKGGMRNDRSTWYYHNGIKSAVYHYTNDTNDTIDGTVTTWFDNGSLKSVVLYSDGLQHGDYKEYHSNNNIKTMGRFDHGTKIGKWIYFNLEGKVASTEKFAN